MPLNDLAYFGLKIITGNILLLKFFQGIFSQSSSINPGKSITLLHDIRVEKRFIITIECEFETDAVLRVNRDELSRGQFGNTCQSNQKSISREVS